jgi:hypothetical protein
VTYGSKFENYRNIPHFLASFTTVKATYALIFTKNTKNVLGYILGDFSTYSSGHSENCPTDYTQTNTHKKKRKKRYIGQTSSKKPDGGQHPT